MEYWEYINCGNGILKLIIQLFDKHMFKWVSWYIFSYIPIVYFWPGENGF
jgi:hypothetical protein